MAVAEPRWVSIEAVIALNRDIAAVSGEPHAVLDRAALHEAVAHPWNKWVYFMDGDLAVLAATLFSSVGTARAFATANKRTAFRATAAFLAANGYQLDLGENDRPIEQLLGFYDGRLGFTGLVEWFRLWMSPLDR